MSRSINRMFVGNRVSRQTKRDRAPRDVYKLLIVGCRQTPKPTEKSALLLFWLKKKKYFPISQTALLLIMTSKCESLSLADRPHVEMLFLLFVSHSTPIFKTSHETMKKKKKRRRWKDFELNRKFADDQSRSQALWWCWWLNLYFLKDTFSEGSRKA